jgi:acyl-CoA thioester hydrolase
MKELKASKTFDIRFSEVDSMQFVWHGSYALYFEDAREAFGKKYDLSYQKIYDSGFFAPLVDLKFHFRQALRYGMKPRIDIVYRPTDAAKLIFDYEIHDTENDELLVSGQSVQVFLDHDYQLLWENPPFFEAWKHKWLAL